jgi:probable phosphoglycerate mutase
VLDSDFEEWRSEDGSIEPEEWMRLWEATPVAGRPFARVSSGCETWLEFSTRVQQALYRVTQEHAGKDIVIVCHGGVIQASFIYCFHIANAFIPGVVIGNTSITHWSQAAVGQRWILQRYNDTSHL